MPQLRLLHQAAERRRAENGLLAMRVIQAAVASCNSNENAGLFKGLANDLMKLL